MPSVTSHNMRPVEPVQRQEPTPVRAPPPLQAKGRDDVDKTQATDTNQLPDSHVPSNIPSFLLSTMRLVPSFARSRTWDALGYSESMRTSFALSKAAIDPLTVLQRSALVHPNLLNDFISQYIRTVKRIAAPPFWYTLPPASFP